MKMKAKSFAVTVSRFFAGRNQTCIIKNSASDISPVKPETHLQFNLRLPERLTLNFDAVISETDLHHIRVRYPVMFETGLISKFKEIFSRT